MRGMYKKVFRCLYRRCPPLPIPNREVKPARADGIAVTGGRVGRCLILYGSPLSTDSGLSVFRGQFVIRYAGREADPFRRHIIHPAPGISSYPINPGPFPVLGPSSHPFNPGSNPTHPFHPTLFQTISSNR